MTPNTLPRISNNLNATHNPRTFIATWALTTTLIETAFADAGTGGGGDVTPFLQNGWLKTAVDSEPAILAPNSPNLSVTLRDGAQLFLGGEWITVDGDVLLGDIPTDDVTWLTLAYSVVEEAQVWEPTWHATRPEPGTGVVAQVTTDGEAVTEVVTTSAETDIIPSLPYLMQLLMPTDGGESGGATQGQITALQLQIDELRLLLAAIQGATGDTEEVSNESEINCSDVMRLQSHYVRQFPDYALETNTTLDQPRYAGHAQILDGGLVSTDVYAGGTATVDFETNSIHG